MRHGIFVTGTDTNVGKTVVAAAALIRYRDALHPRYWKPIQTGIDTDDDTAEVARLAHASEAEIVRAGVRLARPRVAALGGKTQRSDDPRGRRDGDRDWR